MVHHKDTNPNLKDFNKKYIRHEMWPSKTFHELKKPGYASDKIETLNSTWGVTK